MRTYREMLLRESFQERLEYLKLLDNNVTSPRTYSGRYFTSAAWRHIRNMVIERDGRFDLGVFGMYIDGPVYVHHIEPITVEDLETMSPKVTSMDNLVCTSLETHNAIHYKNTAEEYVERRPGDTLDW